MSASSHDSGRKKFCNDLYTLLNVVKDNIDNKILFLEEKIFVIKSIQKMIEKNKLETQQLFFLIDLLGGYLSFKVFKEMGCKKHEYYEKVMKNPQRFINFVTITTKDVLGKYQKELNKLKIKKGVSYTK